MSQASPTEYSTQDLKLLGRLESDRLPKNAKKYDYICLRPAGMPLIKKPETTALVSQLM
jgi:hypothetical protein